VVSKPTKKYLQAMVLFLLDKGLDIEARDVEGCTPLHLAAREGNLEQVKALVEESEKDQRGTYAYQ
jgi:ankyrin repeat protein